MTDRDRLLAALFAVREARQLHRHVVADIDADLIIQVLIDQGAGLSRHCDRAYGMPSWGGEVVNWLLDEIGADASPWDAAMRFAVVQGLVDDPADPRRELLELLDVLVEQLDQSQPPPADVASVFERTPRLLAASQVVPRHGAGDRRSPEAAWRDVRMDVVLAHEGAESGLVLGLELVADLDPHDTSVPGWMSEEFRAAVRDGQSVAVRLLQRLGDHRAADEAGRPRRIADPRLPRPARLEGASVGLAAALHVLRDSSGSVDLGPPAVIASGVFDGVGRLEPMRKAIALPKAASVLADGTSRPLAAPSRCSGVVHVGSLEEAAIVAWPDTWPEYARSSLASRLESQHMHGGVGTECPWAPSRDGPLVRPQAADEILTELRRPDGRSTSTIVLGGPARSGKTTIAQVVADDLGEQGWSIAWLAAKEPFIDGDPDAFKETAKWLVAPDRTGQVLLIIDDLTAVVSADLDYLAQAVDGKADGVLLVATYAARDNTRRFSADRVYHVRSSSSESELRGIAVAMIDAQPELEPARPSVDAVLGASNRDLGLLHQLLVWAAQTSPLQYSGVPDRWRHEVLGRLGPEQLEAARRLAAGSLLGLEVSERQLLPLTFAELTRIGGRRGKFGWCLPSPFLAKQTVRLQPDRVMAAPGRLGELVREFAPVEDLSQDRVRAAADAAPRLGSEIASWLVEMLSRQGDWSNWTHPTTFAVVLDRLGDWLDVDQTDRLVNALVRKLQGRMNELTALQLAACLRQVRRFTDDATTLEWPLSTHLSAVLDRESGSAARLALLVAIVDLRLPDEHQLLVSHLAPFFQRMHAGDDDDRAIAVRMVRALVRHSGYSDPATEDSHLLQRYRPVRERHAAVQIGDDVTFTGDSERVMLQQEAAVLPFLEPPAAAATLISWTSWLDLCATLEYDPHGGARADWDALVQIAGPHVINAVDPSRPMQCVTALAELHNAHPGLAVRLIHRSELLAPVQAIVDRPLSLGQRAAVLSLLWRVHAQTARDALLVEDPNDRSYRPHPRQKALDACIRDAETRVDPRGLGILLQIVNTIDDTFGDPANGFGRALAEKVGWRALIQNLEIDDRAEVTAHLVRTLADANVDYLQRAIDSVIERTTRLLAQRQPNALEIARALVSTSVAGQLLPRLARDLRLNDGRPSPARDGLLALATGQDAGRSGSRAARVLQPVPPAHMLIAAVDPSGLPLSHYVRDLFLSGGIVFGSSRPQAVASAISALASTLARAGITNARAAALGAAAPGSWAGRLSRMRRPELVVETLDHLHSLSPAMAKEACDSLARQASGRNRLVDWLVVSVRQDTALAAHFAATINRIDSEEVGPLVWSTFATKRAWRRLREDVLYMQDPRAQAISARALMSAGWEPRESDMARLWESRWRHVLYAIRSPAALSELLLMLRKLPDAGGRARDAATQLGVHGVSRRLRAGMTEDLAWLPVLLGTLHDLGETAVAQEIARALDAERVASRAPLDKLAAIVRVVASIGLSDLASDIRSSLPARHGREAQRAGVRDPGEHWTSLGDIAECVNSDEFLRLEEQPRTLHVADTVGVLWGTARVARTDWIGGLMPEALAGISHARDDLSCADLARLVAAGLHHGVGDAVLAAPMPWDRLAKATATDRAILESAICVSPNHAELVRNFLRPT